MQWYSFLSINTPILSWSAWDVTRQFVVLGSVNMTQLIICVTHTRRVRLQIHQFCIGLFWYQRRRCGHSDGRTKPTLFTRAFTAPYNSQSQGFAYFISSYQFEGTQSLEAAILDQTSTIVAPFFRPCYLAAAWIEPAPLSQAITFPDVVTFAPITRHIPTEKHAFEIAKIHYYDPAQWLPCEIFELNISNPGTFFAFISSNCCGSFGIYCIFQL